MKIYVDTIIFDLQKAGGISVYFYEIISRLITDKDIELILVDSGKDKRNIFYQKLDLKNTKIVKSNKLFNRYRPVNYNESEKHIFISSYYRYSKNKNAVNMSIVHDFTYEYYIKGLKKIIHTNQKYKAIHESDAIVCISNNTLSDIKKFVPAVDGKRIDVIYNGVSDAYKKMSESDLQGTIKTFPQNQQRLLSEKYVLFIGARGGYKNWNRAVELFKKFPNDYKMITVGGKPLNQAELSLVEDIKDKHLYLPPVDETVLNALYNNAQCLLYLSEYEGFGIPVVEAQKCGCPVIAINASSIPEVAGEGTMLLDSTEPNINEILNFISKDFIYTKEFSWDNCYTELKKICSKNINT